MTYSVETFHARYERRPMFLESAAPYQDDGFPLDRQTALSPAPAPHPARQSVAQDTPRFEITSLVMWSQQYCNK